MRYRGSFTIEAALIMPLILGVIVLFIHIGMFCHDRCAMEHVCVMACRTAVYEESPEEAAREYAVRELPEKLLCIWETDIRTYEDGPVITVEIEAKTPLFDRSFIHRAKSCRHFHPKY